MNKVGSYRQGCSLTARSGVSLFHCPPDLVLSTKSGIFVSPDLTDLADSEADSGIDQIWQTVK